LAVPQRLPKRVFGGGGRTTHRTGVIEQAGRPRPLPQPPPTGGGGFLLPLPLWEGAGGRGGRHRTSPV
jgi:hypothetical protein